MLDTIFTETIHFASPIWLYIYAVFAILLFFNSLTVQNLFHNLTFKYTYTHTYYQTLSKILFSKNTLQAKKNRLLEKVYYLVIAGLFFVSLANPYKTGQKLPDPPDNRDIIFLVDNEVSMVLKDYFIDNKRVDRLTMVKSVLLNFANKLAGNRIGIVTFSEQAHTLLPLTTDTELIKKMIPRIEATLTGRTSNPQKALLYALNYLHNIKKGEPKNYPKIVLITDVLRPPRDVDPNVVAEYLNKQGYKLYVIAIGASTYNPDDVESSSLIYHPASFERLKNIAQSAQGKFYWAKNTKSLNEMIHDILKSKKQKVLTKAEYINIPLFQWPLASALVLIFFQFLLNPLFILVFRRQHA
ncbi:VWA domain-containing protein [Beggiatoa alba]|nr:VWA domain-containing protein [Beggiatoa alba]